MSQIAKKFEVVAQISTKSFACVSSSISGRDYSLTPKMSSSVRQASNANASCNCFLSVSKEGRYLESMSIASLIPKISPSGKLGACQPQIDISSLFAAAHGLRTPAMTSRAICLEKMRFASRWEGGYRTASSPNIALTNDSTSDEDRTFISPASRRMDGESNPASRRSAAIPGMSSP
jgi:hypothetical protein